MQIEILDENEINVVTNDGWNELPYEEKDPLFGNSPAYSITETDKTNWNNKSEFSGDYSDLTNKPSIPSKTSDLTNDSGFLTQHQDISGKQDTLVSGTNIKTVNNESILGSGNITIQGGGTSNYNDLSNKPSINNITLSGNKSLSDLGIQPTSDKVTSITSSSTNTQYPSAKAVYDLFTSITDGDEVSY